MYKEVNNNGFIDLGLPSRTLWREEVEIVDIELPYEKFLTNISNLSDTEYIPTENDFAELFTYCKVKHYTKGYIKFLLLTGPNGNKIRLINYYCELCKGRFFTRYTQIQYVAKLNNKTAVKLISITDDPIQRLTISYIAALVVIKK